ncbi:MAG: ELM1/GtrOC1 family putative glycosyltransferase [Candidatus Omnitrophota bacterium]|jgi:lauroyl/myristoyl acyltransferase/mitochondrial fission protein ELM1
MKNSFLIDYLGCILFKVFGPLFRAMPLSLSFFLGRRLGDFFYYFDSKHKAIAYANIKKVFGFSMSSSGLSRLTRDFYQSFGQSIIEVFLIPLINQNYIDKYITIEGKDKVSEAFKKKKGVILVSVHAGSWELANIISSNLGFPFSMFIRQQGLPRLNELLNDYRKQKGCRIISREGGLKEAIKALNNNEAIGMTVDQGGSAGLLIDFFGLPASIPKGAVKLALRHEAVLIPIFFARVNGPKIKVWAGEEVSLSASEDEGVDIRDNLRKIIAIFEDFIFNNPKEYLWTYKIWKHSNKKKILILSDGRAGHLHQSEAVAREAQRVLARRNIQSEIEKVEVSFRNNFRRIFLNLFPVCLSKSLSLDSFRAVSNISADIIISAGSSLSGVNFLLSRENLSKSIVIMRPAFLGPKKFSLAIVPRHDLPAKRKNVVVTDAALSLIDEEFLDIESKKLAASKGLNKDRLYIAVLVGGNSKRFKLSSNSIVKLMAQLKSLSLSLNAEILLTTSRRTPKEVEEIIKRELEGFYAVKLMVIANETNIPEAIGGILGLSSIVISTPESISMVSEAVNSRKYVFIFDAPGLSLKHKRFLKYLTERKYIYRDEIDNLGNRIKDIWATKPVLPSLSDTQLLNQALNKIL